MRSASTWGLPPRQIRPQLNDHLYHSGARPGKAGNAGRPLKLLEMNKGSVRFAGLNVSNGGGRNARRNELIEEPVGGFWINAEQQAS
jgi:hypothetical protein